MLEQWFDLSEKISKEELDDALEQMMFYAYKYGLDIDSKEVKQELSTFRKSVYEHNKKFPIDFNKKVNNVLAYSFNENLMIELNTIEKESIPIIEKRKKISRLLSKIKKEDLSIIEVGGGEYFFDVDSNTVVYKKKNGERINFGEGEIKLLCKKNKKGNIGFYGNIKTKRYF
jgi:sugar diacid utilization regulator